ncbi:type II toxin-antitoxin system PemK/MazF family toxin [candidate division KSB1 bacterium]|nr:type II toxin-antitoxin system PemK/MazF family toxin [candidate division KSB1 bacterium]NIR73426.1 type II toxin-antitoxin system PemK/MazF family toxin [candidate division KSB1 bacterium]NIS28417.1 type II toxin-antitoxin system PemK/MazF family toxin [candidate division KSB1 bacterium]NIT75297.1 type II toxin-antitoxin system PemK/MazF family toxin [candidate division KSB1 bacterium]NIU29145.1 type II toxin-antitoxin system PemK/MazF family toxin [candidate division KSB1 bacterium]
MSSLRYGDVVEIKLNRGTENQKSPHRYGVIISADAINDNLKTVIVCPLIDAKEVKESRVGVTFIPNHIIGVERDSLAFSLQIKTISKDRIVKRINSVPRNYMGQIKKSLYAVLDLA